jgi:hypothetical protein
MELRQAQERLAKRARGKYQCDLLRDETTGHKGQNPSGRTVEPLRVVNDTGDRLRLSGFSEKAKNRQTDEESIRRGPRPETERDVKRVVLGLRQPLAERQEGRTQLLNRGKGELHLSLDPGRADDPKLGSSLDCVLEQRRLTDARLAVHHQYATTSGTRCVQQPVEYLALSFPAEQHPA